MALLGVAPPQLALFAVLEGVIFVHLSYPYYICNPKIPTHTFIVGIEEILRIMSIK